MQSTELEKPTAKKGNVSSVIRYIYLYLVAVIGLITFVMGAIGAVNIVLKNYVFQVNDFYYVPSAPIMEKTGPCAQPYLDPTDTQKKRLISPSEAEIKACEDRQTENDRKQQELNRKNDIGRDLSIAIAQLLIGLPLWLFHWSIIQNENRKKII